jgi:hypothetical protein
MLLSNAIPEPWQLGHSLIAQSDHIRPPRHPVGPVDHPKVVRYKGYRTTFGGIRTGYRRWCVQYTRYVVLGFVA